MEINKKIQNAIQDECIQKNVHPDMIIKLIEDWLIQTTTKEDLGSRLEKIYLQMDGSGVSHDEKQGE